MYKSFKICMYMCFIQISISGVSRLEFIEVVRYVCIIHNSNILR